MALQLLIVLLVIATLIDGYCHRIPNLLTGFGLIAGLSLTALDPTPGVDLQAAVVGMVIGFLFLLPGYLLGRMGAGDVKLMAMAGTFLGPNDIVVAGLMTMMAGGLLAVAWLAVSHLLAQHATPRHSETTADASGSASTADMSITIWKRRFPFALAIGTGCVLALLVDLELPFA